MEEFKINTGWKKFLFWNMAVWAIIMDVMVVLELLAYFMAGV